jgi:hypothetical protein
LVATADPYSWVPTVTLTVTVSPSAPIGSTVELLNGTTVLGSGKVEKVGSKDEVVFTVEFFEAGTYNFTAKFMGSGSYAASTSNTVTVTVGTEGTAQRNPWSGRLW